MTREYCPPVGDEPLDEIERAVIRALVSILAREIREELEAERQHDEAPERTARKTG